MEDLSKKGFEILKNAIKTSNSLPSGENFDYYSCFPSFNEARKGEIKKLLDTMQSIMSKAGIEQNVKQRDIQEKFDLLIDANDLFLDRANACMDEECGIKRNVAPKLLLVSESSVSKTVNGSWNKSSRVSTGEASNAHTVRLLAGKLIERPQSYFKDKIDNSQKPWEPRLKYKHNLLKPLDIHLIESENGPVFNHPYEFELDKFKVPESQLQFLPPVKYNKLEDTKLIMVEKPEELKILLEDLRKYNEIAVDLEHHSYRSFQGITCLMQISTRDTDYIVDTLSLRSELHELNEIFTKPSVLKVFHGADLDVQWLQRDLSLYVVNMFDTHQAAKQLALPYLSLAHLLKKYCNIDPNKHFQLADWRIRPLPEELLKYAREDTHYLLYIKDMLRNELLNSANGQTNILKAVFDRSTNVCRITYKKPIWSEDSYLNMYRKSQKMFNNRQLCALKELHRWRDQIARSEDDSTNYVLPNHMMLHIAEVLPKEMQGILALCNPIPPLVRANLLTIHNIIRKAMQQPLVKPILVEEMRVRMPKTNQVGNSDVWSPSPHDFSRDMEARADLPCLLDTVQVEEEHRLDEIEHHITVFDSPPVSEDESSVLSKLKKIFVSPYERYRRVIPMVAEYEAKEAEKKMKEEEERIKKLTEEKKDNEERVGRIHDHFVQVASEVQTTSRKRKRESDEETEETEDRPTKEEVVCKQTKQEERRYRKKMKREERKRFRDDMKNFGLLPAERYNYKNVDFSSFQGGSKSNANTTKFQQQKMKDKVNKNKKKKRKQPGLKI